MTKSKPTAKLIWDKTYWLERGQEARAIASEMRVFLSSRRRQTRGGRDWSSDVCSSDLAAERQVRGHVSGVAPEEGAGPRIEREDVSGRLGQVDHPVRHQRRRLDFGL